jgi:hypothetical protein
MYMLINCKEIHIRKNLLRDCFFNRVTCHWKCVLHCKTDEAHVTHNLKIMDSAWMTSLIQTVENWIIIMKFQKF